jgi:low affinity Fe/Cu permease
MSEINPLKPIMIYSNVSIVALLIVQLIQNLLLMTIFQLILKTAQTIKAGPA